MKLYFSTLQTVFALAAVLSASIAANGQTFPLEWKLQPESHQIKVGNPTEEGFYFTEQLLTVDLEFEISDWQSELENNYDTDIYLPAMLTYNGEVIGSVGVQYKGQTSYFMLPPGAEKMSFSIKTNAFDETLDLDGYSNLNLNNAFQDASFLREFTYLNLVKKHIPAAKCNFVHLNINGESWGLYINAQQLNKDMLAEWFLSNEGTYWRADSPAGTGGGGGGGGPQWGDGTAALNYLSDDQADYQEYYTLKNSEEVDPWELLVNTCDVLDNTLIANLPLALPEVMDVDKALWLMACEIAFSDDDSYIYKGKMDYYVHWEKESGLISPMEFDGNSVLNTQNLNWGAFYHADNVNYPVMNRLMQVPEYRQRYLAHLRTVIDELLDLTTTENLLDTYSAMIDAEVEADDKKLFTYAQFTAGVTSLQNAINSRRTTLNANAEVNVDVPIISDVMVVGTEGEWTVLPGESPLVTCSATATDGLEVVRIHYNMALTGNFTVADMNDVGGGQYSASLPAIDLGGVMRFYIESVRANTAGTITYLPAGAEHDVFYYITMPEWVDSPVAVNELLAKNTVGAADEPGQFEDWIELYNNGSEAVDISGWYLSDNLTILDKWEVPTGTLIGPGAYMVFWADEDLTDGPMHTNFKLTGSGENLTLLTSEFKIADQVYFGPQVVDMGLARVPNGTGPFEIQQPTFAAFNGNVGVAESWYHDELSIFPNPFSEEIRIVFERPIETQTAWRITDLMGRELRSGIFLPGSNSFRINPDIMAPGAYVLTLQYRGVSVSKSILRQ